MSVCHDKLFHLMIDRKIQTSQLCGMCGFSANILAKLKKYEYISMESLEKICLALDCKVDDILEFIPSGGKR